MARAQGGRFLLRIEDIDQSRARPEWEAQIYDDLAWLGLSWPMPAMRQSDRLGSYGAALDLLWARGLLYPCSCNRRDILAAASAPQEGAEPAMGPDGVVYPGTCRNQPRTGPRPTDAALRLDMRAAMQGMADPQFLETGSGQPRNCRATASEMIEGVGDIVLSRRDMGTSYHLSVVLDDAAQQITHVIRGMDLLQATHIHAVLQRLFDLSSPIYHHHRLIRDETGKRLAKRDDARAIATYRAEGATPDDIRRMVGLD